MSESARASIQVGDYLMLESGRVYEVTGELAGWLHLTDTDSGQVVDVDREQWAAGVEAGTVQRVERTWRPVGDAPEGRA